MDFGEFTGQLGDLPQPAVCGDGGAERITWLRSAGKDKPLQKMWLAILLSFLFYFPVVLWAQAVPIIGMMMLPKTCMYIWIILMFLKVSRT